jgi:surfactin synthase thioesterase subunit
VTEIVPALSRELAGLEPLPCALYGHSMGAIVAFELARALAAQGAAPARLFVSGRRAPDLPLSHPPLHALDEPALLGYLRAMGGVDGRLLARPQWTAGYLPTLRADLQVSDAYVYRPGPPLPLPIHAFRGRHDASVSLEEILGWRRHTAAGFVFRSLPGGHFFEGDGRACLRRVIAREVAGTAARGGR